VGANIGLYTLFAAKLCPSCRVYAFEPESNNFSSLCRNVLLNRLENVIPCSFPLSGREGFALFHVYGLEPGAALHSLGEPSAFREEAPTLLQGTLTTTLDAVVRPGALPSPTLLKLDVDGLEESILDGGPALLASTALRSILVEVTTANADDVSWAERKLARHRFRPTAEEWSTEIPASSRNYIFDR
jgi:FkbM family methyltransferase